jgi:hypothetical protein
MACSQPWIVNPEYREFGEKTLNLGSAPRRLPRGMITIPRVSCPELALRSLAFRHRLRNHAIAVIAAYSLILDVAAARRIFLRRSCDCLISTLIKQVEQERAGDANCSCERQAVRPPRPHPKRPAEAVEDTQ